MEDDRCLRLDETIEKGCFCGENNAGEIQQLLQDTSRPQDYINIHVAMLLLEAGSDKDAAVDGG